MPNTVQELPVQPQLLTTAVFWEVACSLQVMSEFSLPFWDFLPLSQTTACKAVIATNSSRQKTVCRVCLTGISQSAFTLFNVNVPAWKIQVALEGFVRRAGTFNCCSGHLQSL